MASSLVAGPAGATQSTTNIADCTYVPVTNGTPVVLLPNLSLAASVEEATGNLPTAGDIIGVSAGMQVTVECVASSLPTVLLGNPVETTVVVITAPTGVVIDNNNNSVYESSCGSDAAALGPAACLSDGNAPSLVNYNLFPSPGNDGAGNKITCPSTDHCVTFTMQETGDATFPFKPADAAAQCPPSAAQVNAGLTNCALAVFGTTNTATGAGLSINSNLVDYATQATSWPTEPLPTPNPPTLAVSPLAGGAGSSISVSDAASPTGYWWSNAMYNDGYNSAGGVNGNSPLLTSATIPAGNIWVGTAPAIQPAASSSVVVSPATYTTTVTGTCPSATCAISGVLTPPAISGSFTLPASLAGGITPVVIFEPNNAFAFGNIDAAHLPPGVTEGANAATPDIWAASGLSVMGFSSTSLPAGTANKAYSEALATTGGSGSYSCAVASGSSLPGWATLTGCTISGTPALTDVTSSPTPFTINVTDTTYGFTNSGSFSIVVHSATLSLTATPSSGVGGTVVSFSGLNWPAGTVTVAFTTACATCSGVDSVTATPDVSGDISGTITITAVSGTGLGEAVGNNPLVATEGTSVASAPFTVNSATACSVPAAGACTLNQIIGTTVYGTSLYASESSGTVTLSPITLGLGTGTNNQMFQNATGALGVVTISDDRGSLAGWTVTGQMETNFMNATPSGNAIDNTIPADFLTWIPTLQLETPGMIPADNANTAMCPSTTGSCQGPSGLPAASSDTNATIVGGTLPAGFNGTGLGTGGVSVVPAEVYVGATTVLNNKDTGGVAKVLCEAPAGGGGGGFLCGAGLSLAVPPYVAAGTYSATMDIVVTGL